MTTRTRKSPRVLFLGMDNQLSGSALQMLIQARINVCMVAIPQFDMGLDERSMSTILLQRPKRVGSLNIINRFVVPDIVGLAWSSRIMTVAVSNPSNLEVQDLILGQRADIVCVACFPWLIPSRLLDAIPLGFLNLHPSLLPLYQGPHPLFWIFRNGDLGRSGVTIHRMDERFDHGDIISQAPVTLTGGISGPEAEAICGRIGGQLLIKAILAYETAIPEGRPQPKGGHYYGAPADKDFSIHEHWPAERAYNFVRGTSHWKQPYRLQIGSETFLLIDVISYTPDGRLDTSPVISDGTLHVQMNPGTLKASVTLER